MTLTDPAATVHTDGWGADNAHDPTAVRDDDGVYWLFSTDAYADGPVRGGAQIRRSTDLVTWTFHGWALRGVPDRAAAWSGARGLWAPEVVRAGDGWRMYYSASTFGSRTSAIGLATAPHPAGPWTDQGLVVTSLHDVPGPNAIDANVVRDHHGRTWLVYGSFFGGIHALELDETTGFAVDSPAPGEPSRATGVLLARRPRSVDGAIEGAFVVPRPGGGYALLVSYDSLSGSYHLRAAVADEVTGPWHDRGGRSMTDLDLDPHLVGTTVLAGHRLAGGRSWLAPGHASVLTDPAAAGRPARQLLVHHVRDGAAPTRHEVQVRRLVWTADGWPLVSPQPWAGAREQDDESTWPTDAGALVGRWELLDMREDPTHVVDGRMVDVDTERIGAVRPLGRGRFSAVAPDGSRWQLVVFPAWDAVRGTATTCVVALDDDGRVVAGTRR